MRRILKLWVREEESALHQQLLSENLSERFRGLRRSKRNEAKLFLLACVPVLITGLFVPKWSDANGVQKGIMALTGAWFAIVLVVGLFFLFRTLVQISRRNDG